MPPYTIHPCTLADSNAAAKNNILAFYPDPIWRTMLNATSKTSDYMIEQNSIRYPKFLLTDRPHRRHELAVDSSTGEVVGYTRWQLPEGKEGVWTGSRVGDVEGSVEEAAAKEAEKADFGFDERFREGMERNAAVRKGLMDGKGYFLLDVLAIPEEHWRKGIGSVMLKSGFEVADKEGLDIFVQANDGGKPFYEKHGFEVVGQSKPPENLGDEGRVAYFLVRYANASGC